MTGWVGQNLSVHMTLSVERIDMCLTLTVPMSEFQKSLHQNSLRENKLARIK